MADLAFKFLFSVVFYSQCILILHLETLFTGLYCSIQECGTKNNCFFFIPREKEREGGRKERERERERERGRG